MNEKELAMLDALLTEFKRFKRNYTLLWAGVFISAIILRAFGLWG